MILICTADEKLAKALRRSIGSGRVSVVTVDARSSYTYAEKCVAEAARERPSAIFLDVRSGGTGVRAVETIPWLLKASPLSVIVVLTLRPDETEIDEIEQLGAYTFIDMARPDIPEQVRLACAGVGRVASSRHGARAMRRRSSLH